MIKLQIILRKKEIKIINLQRSYMINNYSIEKKTSRGSGSGDNSNKDYRRFPMKSGCETVP